MDKIHFYEQNLSFRKTDTFDKLTIDDYKEVSDKFIKFIDELTSIDKKNDKKMWIYLSLGGAYNDENENFCLENQLFPNLYYLDDYEPIYIALDNFGYSKNVDSYKKENTHIFNMYWFDNYKPLVDSFEKLIKYIKKTKGMLICINFCKYINFKSPVFTNLPSLFYKDYANDDSFVNYNKIYFKGSKIKFHLSNIKHNRCLYLDWGGENKLYLLGYNNPFLKRKLSVLITNISDLENLEKDTPTLSNEIHFNIDKLFLDIF